MIAPMDKDTTKVSKSRYMMSYLNSIKLVLKDDSGATAIEYGLIVGLIFLVIVGGVTSLGSDLGVLYEDVATEVSTAL